MRLPFRANMLGNPGRDNRKAGRSPLSFAGAHQKCLPTCCDYADLSAYRLPKIRDSVEGSGFLGSSTAAWRAKLRLR